MIAYLKPGQPPAFPDPRNAEEGLVAAGGDLSVERLLHAYDQGIFPWFSQHELPLWWCPDPRGVLEVDNLHVSRSLERRIRRGDFELTWNRAFGEVLRECGRFRQDGTWIHSRVIRAYEQLFELGHAHSLEVWQDGELVGGLYGVQRGGVFSAESKFYRQRDMSKVALVASVQSLFRAGIEVFDVQFRTDYLARLGVTEVLRERFVASVRQLRDKPVDLGSLEPSISA